MRKRAAVYLTFRNVNRTRIRTPGSLLTLAVLVLASFHTAGFGEDKKAAGQPPSAAPPPRAVAGLGPLEPVGTPSPAQAVPPELRKAIREYRAQIQRITLDYPGGEKVEGSRRVSRDYRGNLYEYFRNDALDALPHEVRQANGTKSLLRRNQFGFNLTGPVTVPRLYDGRGRTFFSIAYEGTREKISRPFLGDLPTALQRSGDFSDLVDNAGRPVAIYDPATTRPNLDYDPGQPVSLSNLQYLRDPFPGNRIPAHRLDPVALKALAYYPQPNANVGPFLRNNFFANAAETNTPNGTVWKLDHDIGTRHKLTWNGRFSSGIDGSAPIFANPANPGRHQRRVGSRSGRFSHTSSVSPRVVNQFSLWARYRSLASTQENIYRTHFPEQLGINGLRSGAFPRFDLGHFVDIGTQPGAMTRYQIANYSLSDAISLRYNKHNLKLHGKVYWRQVNSFRSRYPSGRFDFSGELTGLPGVNNTGSPAAQFLLGMPDRAQQSIVSHPTYMRSEQYEMGVSDEYQITPKLTWTFRLNLELDTAPREKFDRQSSLDFEGLNPENGRPGILVFAGRDGRPRTFTPNQVSWEPGVAVAVSPWGDRRTVIRANYGLYSDSLPLDPTNLGTLGFNATPLLTSPNRQLEPVLLLRQGFPQVANPPDLTSTAANNQDAAYFERHLQMPESHEWRLEVERDFSDFAVRMAYIGERGTHLFMGNDVNLNPLAPSALQFRDRLNDLEFNQSLRPFPQFRRIAHGYNYPAGSNSLHRGLLRVDKRLSKGLSFTGSYSYSKAIDNLLRGKPPQNSTNLQAEKSLSSYDRTHRLRASYLYELPFGEGRRFSSSGNWINSLGRGWTMSGMSVFQSGTPIRLRPLFNNTGGVAESLRVNLVPGVDPHLENRSAFQWFNPVAFDQPEDFTLGDGPRNHPTLRNPSFWNLDMSLSKRVPVSEDWTLEFIGEAFNALNHANLNRPDAVIGSRENPNSNAGRIIGSRGGRIVQLGLRLSF